MRLFRTPQLPTADLYLHVPMRAFIAERARPSPEKPISRLGPHLYAGNGRALLVRYATRMELWRLARMRPQRCAWLIDDNLWALEEDASLPAEYRARLTRFREKRVPRILDLCDTVVAPSAKILRLFPDHRRALIHPSCVHVCRDFSHFESPRRVEVIFSGTRSHLADLEAIARELRKLCERNAALRLTTFLGHHAPAALRGLANIEHLPPMSWERYREMLKRRRFHLGIAMFRDTAFNRSRSVNKILDHAAFGAAGIYVDAPPFSGVVRSGEDGLLVAANADFASAMQSLLDKPERMRRLAEGGAALAARLGDPANNRRFWMDFFGLDSERAQGDAKTR